MLKYDKIKGGKNKLIKKRKTTNKEKNYFFAVCIQWIQKKS